MRRGDGLDQCAPEEGARGAELETTRDCGDTEGDRGVGSERATSRVTRREFGAIFSFPRDRHPHFEETKFAADAADSMLRAAGLEV